MQSIPVFLSWPLFALVWITTALRLIFVRSTVAECRINSALVFASTALALRRSWIQPIVESWLGFGVASVLGNICIMLTAASLISLFSAWALGPERLVRIHLVTVTMALVAGAGLIALSAPARSRRVSVSEAGGWQFTAYLTTYAMPLLCAALLIAWISIRNLRAASPGRQRRIFLAVIALSVFEIVDMALVIVAGLAELMSEDNAFTEARSDSGLSIRLLVISAGAIISAGPVIRVLGHRWRSRRVIRRLQPMWRTLTGAVPEVVLELRPADRRALSVRGRLDRMSVEIRDAIMILDRHVVFELGDHTGIAPPVVTAARLHLACLARSAGHRAHGTGGTTHRFATDVGGEPWELARLADHWNDGEQMAAALWARRLPQFGGPEDPSARVPAQV